MWITIVLVLGYLLIPVFLIYLTHISTNMRKIGAVVLAYGVGLFIGNIGIFPRASENLRNLLAAQAATSLPEEQLIEHFNTGVISSNDLMANQIASTQESIYSIMILIAIPLLLFSLDLRRWLTLASEALKSFLLAIVSLFTAIIIGFVLWGSTIPESWKVGGMLVGVYTGGTPNLAAIATAVEVSPNIFILTHTYDVVLGAIFLFFLMTVAQRIFNLFLPHFRDSKKHKAICKIAKETEVLDNYLGMLNLKAALKLGVALLLAIIIVGVSFGLSMLVAKSAQMTVLVLSITTLGLAASLVKRINSIENTFQLGMYFIIVFSLALSSIADLRGMFQIQFLNLFLFVAMAIFGSMIIHVGLSKIFKVDTDTTIITITALTYSAPFVPAVAAAIRNKEVIISGLTVGILGYAFGNYAGVAMAYLLKSFG
jgi:uncharacterized membrane protein